MKFATRRTERYVLVNEPWQLIEVAQAPEGRCKVMTEYWVVVFRSNHTSAQREEQWYRNVVAPLVFRCAQYGRRWCAYSARVPKVAHLPFFRTSAR